MPSLVASRARARLVAGVALAGLSLAACASGPTPRHQPHASAAPSGSTGQKIGKPYQIRGVWYTPRAEPGYDKTGVASWYGEQFHNRHTANGEVFDMDRISAAHTTLPLPSLVEVTNLDNGRRIVVRVNDRGPFVDGRIIDLSRAAARELGYERQGVARVRVRYIGSGPTRPAEARTWQASAPPPRRPAAPKAPVAALPPAMPVASAAFLPSPRHGPEYLPDLRPARVLPAAPVAAGRFRIQAAAFSDRGRAERAAEALSGAGQVEIVETTRAGAVLYRVQVIGEGQAWTVRERVAGLGYADARVIEDF